MSENAQTKRGICNEDKFYAALSGIREAREKGSRTFLALSLNLRMPEYMAFWLALPGSSLQSP
jgi:hypothetical protein